MRIVDCGMRIGKHGRFAPPWEWENKKLKTEKPGMKTRGSRYAEWKRRRMALREHEELVLWLREERGLRYRQISQCMKLRGPGLAQTIYARACRKRRLLLDGPRTANRP